MDTKFSWDDAFIDEISDEGSAEVFKESELGSLNSEEGIGSIKFFVFFRVEVETDEFGAGSDRERVGEGRAREAYSSVDLVADGV